MSDAFNKIRNDGGVNTMLQRGLCTVADTPVALCCRRVLVDATDGVAVAGHSKGCECYDERQQ